MGERLIGFGHAMDIFPFFYGCAGVIRGIQQFSRQLLNHAFSGTGLRIILDPPKRQSDPPHGPDLHGYLIGSTSDASGLDLYDWLHVFDGRFENFQWIVVRLLPNDIKGPIADTFSRALLAVTHKRVDKLPDQLVVEPRVGSGLSRRDTVTPGHECSLDLSGSAGFGPFCAVLGAALTPVLYADRIEGPPDKVVSDTRKILDTTSTHQHDRMLLEIVPHSRDV